ncbi:hypothetical protein SCHPADRAFT_937897 [Schizopora paradoxa]|uniref:DUF6533 domain-containing protein n=1 Tax=Schizopora paradoxa TaxID=27342 RepID=A0A0H2RXV2_9AGAM|nr:hypothetical protein SCHPADRAFT_937897 [Schizopora paradoxa]
MLFLQYTIAATASFVLYEYVINFDFEVRYLWSRSFKLGSCLLFLCRYLPIIHTFVAIFEYVLTSDLTNYHCKSLLIVSSSLVYLQYSLVNAVLYLRTIAIWCGDKRVFMTLVGTYTLSATGTAYTVYRFNRGASELDPHLWSGCITLIKDQSIFYGIVGSVLMDSLALCLLLYKSVQHTREMKNVGFQQVSLLTVMIQDGMVYFIFNISEQQSPSLSHSETTQNRRQPISRSQVCTVASAVVLQRASDAYRDILVTPQCCIQNVLCARLFFHMQIAHRRGVGQTTISKMPSGMCFANPDESAPPQPGENNLRDATLKRLVTTHSDFTGMPQSDS